MTSTSIAKAISVSNPEGLYDAQILRECPAVFAAAAHESRSARYNFISTQEILGALRMADFWPTQVMQSGTRIEGMMGATKHLIRIRHKSDLGNSKSDVFEIIIVNSHNGTSTYQLRTGVFRLVSANGLIVGDTASTMRVQHSGHNEIDALIAATYQIAEEGPALMESIREMKQIQISRDEQLLLAKYAMKARFNIHDDDETDESNVVESTLALPVASAVVPYEPAQFLRRRRSADTGNDLYTTLNVIQENILKPGVRKYDAKGKKHSVRAVNGIDQNVKVNSLIWSFAKELQALHS